MKTGKLKSAPVSQVDVLAWLHQNHPQLFARAVTDRDWVWVAADLSGNQNKPIRESIKNFGFKFAKRGHALSNGQQAFWGHACTRPIPFFRKKDAPAGSHGSRAQNSSHPDRLDDAIGAALSELGIQV